jgi:translation initiation factor 5B
MSEKETGDGAESAALRTPIVAVLGHVDHGKTSLLDKIRGSAVHEGEAGAITQHIGSTAVPLEVISEIAGDLVDPDDFDLPGLLFIDTPGHHSFSTLRSRGGALADIAILVVDVNDGFQPQTEEAVAILKRTATPFIVAANKIDTVPGWNPTPAETGEGVPDLLTVLMGLSQRYMRDEMAIDVEGPGAGTVLEVKDTQGFGATTIVSSSWMVPS